MNRKIVAASISLFAIAQQMGCVAPDESVEDIESVEQLAVSENDGYLYNATTGRFVATRNGITGSAQPKHYVFRVSPDVSVQGEIMREAHGNSRLTVSFSSSNDPMSWAPSGSTCTVVGTAAQPNANCSVTSPSDARLVRVTVAAATDTRTHYRFALRFAGPTSPGQAHLASSSTALAASDDDGTLVYKPYIVVPSSGDGTLPSVFRGQDVTVTISRGTNAGLALENGVKLKDINDDRTELNRLTCGAWSSSGVMSCTGRAEYDSAIHVPIRQSSVTSLASVAVAVTRSGPAAPQPTYIR